LWLHAKKWKWTRLSVCGFGPLVIERGRAGGGASAMREHHHGASWFIQVLRHTGAALPCELFKHKYTLYSDATT
jgi:hypothetical protein